MDVNFLILGSLFILTIFSVGESVYKNFNLNKKLILFTILLLIVGIFLPPIQYNQHYFYFEKHIFPLALSVICLFKIKKVSIFLFSFLLSVLSTMLYLLIIEEIVFNLIPPFLIFGISLGLIIGLCSKNFYENISSLFLGVTAGSVLFFISKYDSLETFFFEPSAFSIVLIAWITSNLVLFLKNKLLLLSSNYSKEEYF